MVLFSSKSCHCLVVVNTQMIQYVLKVNEELRTDQQKSRWWNEMCLTMIIWLVPHHLLFTTFIVVPQHSVLNQRNDNLREESSAFFCLFVLFVTLFSCICDQRTKEKRKSLTLNHAFYLSNMINTGISGREKQKERKGQTCTCVSHSFSSIFYR